MEQWRSVEGAPAYQVSSHGRVMSFKGRNPNGNAQGRIIKGWVGNRGYRRLRINGKVTSLARMVALAFVPNPEDLPEVDQVDRNPLNNRAANLRWASRTLNNLNRRTWGSCCYRGVTFNKQFGKYEAQICHQGNKVYLGVYDTLEEAASVFDFHARELRGSDACLNFT
jgi:hypothetical protein